jgi:hypothetical protein
VTEHGAQGDTTHGAQKGDTLSKYIHKFPREITIGVVLTVKPVTVTSHTSVQVVRHRNARWSDVDAAGLQSGSSEGVRTRLSAPGKARGNRKAPLNCDVTGALPDGKWPKRGRRQAGRKHQAWSDPGACIDWAHRQSRDKRWASAAPARPPTAASTSASSPSPRASAPMTRTSHRFLHLCSALERQIPNKGSGTDRAPLLPSSRFLPLLLPPSSCSRRVCPLSFQSRALIFVGPHVVINILVLSARTQAAGAAGAIAGGRHGRHGRQRAAARAKFLQFLG